MRITLVAKRKAAQKPQGIGRKPVALTIKGNLEWRAWVDRGAAFCRTDTSKLVDAALVDYLKAKGFEEPAPPR